jgi:hypothetical protein
MIRRALVALAALLACGLATGCGETIPGTGTLAADAERPSSTPSPSRESSSDLNEVCQALDPGALRARIGSTVELADSRENGCKVTGADGRSVVVSVFDYLTLTEYKRGEFEELTIAEHPAIRTPTNIVYVARATDPGAEGLIGAYFPELGEGGHEVAVVLLEQLLATFGK